MKIILCLIALILITCNASAGESKWKHDQYFEVPVSKNISLNTEIEVEENTDFNGGLDYMHLQILGEYSSKINMAPGLRYIEKDDKPSSYAPMIDFKKSIEVRHINFKNRVRYMYEVIEDGDDNQVFRYKISTPIKFRYNMFFSPGAEIFANKSVEYTRIRYSGIIGYTKKKYTYGIGYEYDDNHQKDSSTIYTTQMSYKF